MDDKNRKLVITIDTSEPSEERERLLEAIAAAIRWRGNVSNSDAYTHDGQNLIQLAMLQESLLLLR